MSREAPSGSRDRSGMAGGDGGSGRLRDEATPRRPRAALAAWGAAPLPRETFRDTSHRIETMQADISRFEAEVGAVVAAAAPALTRSRGREALPRSTAALGDARRAADERARLERAAAARAATLRGLEADRAALQAALIRVRETLAADDEALAIGLEKLERRRALDEERGLLRRELSEIGDGPKEEKLRAEQVELDLSALPSEITLAEQDQARLQEISNMYLSQART